MNEHESWHLLSAYLDGELAAGERAPVESHLAACGACRGELEALRRAKDLAASAPRRALPPVVLAELERRLERRSWRERLREWAGRPNLWVPAGALAGAVLWLALKGALPGAPEPEALPLEGLLAGHSRYAAEALLADGDPVASNFSAQLAVYYGEPE